MASVDAPLLPVTTRDSTRKPKCKALCCIGSKAARWILLWNFAVLLAYRILYNIDAVMQVSLSSNVPILLTIGYTFIAIFSPIAGLLTDIKFSRYKAVLYSSYGVIIKWLAIISIIVIVASINELQGIVRSTRSILLITAYLLAIMFITVYVILIVNGLQFGMDQLHDSPTEDSVLFIHWYVWIYYTCSLVAEITWNLLCYDMYYFSYLDSLRISGLCVLGLVCVTIFSLLTVSLCVFHYRKVLFLLEPAGVNPYKLVYRVTKFTYRHKVPLRRSAFTYCTEELPSRMDVGKHKYGGPFTTTQVEDVKAFWGILKIVLSIAPAFFLQTVTQCILPAFSKHSNMYIMIDNTTDHKQVHLEGVARHIIISNGLLSPLLVVICIPLYLCWIRPHVRYQTLGMLKRMGLAVVVMVLLLIGCFFMDLVVHLRKVESAECMFKGYTGNFINKTVTLDLFPTPPLYQNMYFFTSQHILSAIVNMLLDIAVLEFICSQSPYSMKGLLLGIFFSIRSLFQGIAITSIIPFGTAWKIQSLSCGSGFYLMNIVIGLAALLLYVYAAKRYKYREVNEPSHEYRYAEEYYSNIHP